MTTTCLKQTALHYSGGGSDKLYILQVQQTEHPGGGTEYAAVFYYGRRGGGLSKAEKGRGPSLAGAYAAFDRQERDKRGKGYDDYSIPASGIPGMPSDAPAFGGPAAPSTAPAASASTPRPATGPMPMLAEVLGETDLDAMLVSPDWVAQKKYDGERVPVSMRRSALVATNRKGVVRGLTTGVEGVLKKTLAQPDFGEERETTVDGELMGDEYVIYDVMTLRDNDVRSMPYYERYAALEALFEDHAGLLAPTAWTEQEKRAMLQQARDEGWEGIIFRSVSSGYVNGRTPMLLKFKLWATATCRVLTANAQRSIQIALRDADGSERFAGNVTVPVNQDIPEPDALVEVRYLYATEGGMLYQPALLQVRTDIDDADLLSSLRQCPPEKRSTPVEGARVATPADAVESEEAQAAAGAPVA